jgi:hypothetical protein
MKKANRRKGDRTRFMFARHQKLSVQTDADVELSVMFSPLLFECIEFHCSCSLSLFGSA